MYTAREKRAQNIAEYILYIWQLEDLLRALELDPDKIYLQLVAPRGLDPDAESELTVWYLDMAELLRVEGKTATGHLEHTLHLVSDMNDLHLQLLKLPFGERYRSLYAPLAPELPALREKLGKVEMNDIELIMRSLYAVMLYRLKKEEGKTAVTDEVVGYMSPLIAELARIYGQIERGEIDIHKTNETNEHS